MPKKRSKSPKKPKSKKKSPSPTKKRAKSKSRSKSASKGAKEAPSKQSVPTYTSIKATQVSEGSLENILNQLSGNKRRDSYHTHSFPESRGRSLYRSDRSNKIEPYDQSNIQKSFRSNSANDMHHMANEEFVRSPASKKYAYHYEQTSDDEMRDLWQDHKPYQRGEQIIVQRAEEARPSLRSYQGEEYQDARMSTDTNRPTSSQRGYQRQEQIDQTDRSGQRYDQSYRETQKVTERSFAPRELFLDKEPEVVPEPKARTIQYEVIPPAKIFPQKEPPRNSRFSKSSRDSADYFVNREISKIKNNRGRRDSSNTMADLFVRPLSTQNFAQDSQLRSGSRTRQEFQGNSQEIHASPSSWSNEKQQHQHDIPSLPEFVPPKPAPGARDISSASITDATTKKHLDQVQDLLSKKTADQAHSKCSLMPKDSKQKFNQTVQKQPDKFETSSRSEQEKTIGKERSKTSQLTKDLSSMLPRRERPLDSGGVSTTDNVSKRSEEANETLEESYSYKTTTPNLILYYDIVSPQSRSCLMLICLLKLDVDLRYTDIFKGEQLTEEYLKINPVHTVPTLVSNDMIFTDSHTILMYLCDNSNNPLAKQLYPESYLIRLKIMNCLFFEAQVLYRRHSNFMTDIVRKEFANIDYAFHEKKILEAYETLNSFLKESPFLVGESMTIADISMVATISALDLMFPIDQYQNVWPELAKWFRNMRAIPMYRLNFAGVMKQGDMVEKIGKFEFPTRGNNSERRE